MTPPAGDLINPHFDVSYDQEVQSQRQQLREIEEAFSRNEFCLYYQPKVNMMTGEVLGAEALSKRPAVPHC